MLDINIIREQPDLVRQSHAGPPDGRLRRSTLSWPWTSSAAL